jgi:hypothetical protein
MKGIKFRYSTKIVKKERNLRFYKSDQSLLNLLYEDQKIKLYANVNEEFLDLHSIKTNRVIIPHVGSFKYSQNKLYVFEILLLRRNQTPKIKNELNNLKKELSNAFKINLNNKQALYRLIIRFTNFTTFDQIDFYLENDERIAA